MNLKLQEFVDNRHMKVIRLSALHTGCRYVTIQTPFAEADLIPVNNVTRRNISMKNPNDPIGN